jgi:hypothetical protein
MTSPVHALLWEIWRVSRVEAAWKIALGLTGALAVLAWTAAYPPADDPAKAKAFGATIAMIFIVAPQFIGWLFLSRLNAYRPGFPLRLLFTRPVRTSVMVGLPLAYLTVVPAAAYLASALLLRAITGYPYPLLPVAAWIAILSLLLVATNWSARKTSVITLLTMVITSAWMLIAVQRLTDYPDGQEWDDSPELWPKIFDFPLTDYPLIAAIGLVAFGVAVARVARQRTNDAMAATVLWTPGTGYPERLVNLFRFPCPTSSATRAQVWLDLKSRGFPALTIAATLAIAIPLLFAVSVPFDAAIEGIRPYVPCTADRGCFLGRPMVLMFAALSLLLVLFQGGNAFGFRYKQGRVYLSAFEMTQAYGTARLAAIKLLVRSACFLAALLAVAVSVWISLPLLGDALFIQMWDMTLASLKGAITGAFAALTGYGLLALVVVVVIGVVIWTAAFATLGALWVRYPRPGNIAASALLVYGLTLALLALAGRFGIVPAFVVDAIFTATRWLAAAAMVFTTVYVFWRGFAERVLTIRYACGALVISAAFGTAWLTLLAAIGAPTAVPMLWPLPLTLIAGVLAPWALNRVRHT